MFPCYVHPPNVDPFPAPFQEPKIEINQKEKTATCSTKGGFPKPKIKWSSGDGGTAPALSEPVTLITNEDNGTFNVSSTVIITGLEEVICDVYNPTSNQTLRATEYLPPSNNTGTWRIPLLKK